MRLPTQSENERNFHIFYQMCKGGDEEERERWELQGKEGLCYYLPVFFRYVSFLKGALGVAVYIRIREYVEVMCNRGGGEERGALGVSSVRNV